MILVCRNPFFGCLLENLRKITQNNIYIWSFLRCFKHISVNEKIGKFGKNGWRSPKARKMLKKCIFVSC